MIISLIRSWTTKVRNALYDALDRIWGKNSSSKTTIIPQYQPRNWNYNNHVYVPITSNQTASSTKSQRQYDYSITFKSQTVGYYEQENNQNKAPASSTITTQYGSTGYCYPFIITNIQYHDTEPGLKDILTDQNKPPTLIVPPPAISNPKKKKKETSKQRRLRRKRSKDMDVIISNTSIVFHDDNANYTTLRTKAHEALIKKVASRNKSDQAFKNGNKKLGRQLLVESRVYHEEMTKLNKQAANHKYNEVNKGRPCNTIDLHGLFVNEAREKVKAAIKKCKAEQMKEMVLIVGKGNHSHNKVSKLKPAMIEYIESLKLQYFPNKPNPGCVLVKLGEPSMISI